MYIIASACTKFSEHWEKSLEELAQEAILLALEQKKIPQKKIDAIWFSNCLQPLLGGQYTINQDLKSQLDFPGPIFTVFGDQTCSLQALYQAWLSIRSGEFETVVVCAAEKMSDWSAKQLTTACTAFLTNQEQINGLTLDSGYALVANAYLNKYKYQVDDLAIITEKNHLQAINNPCAQFPYELSQDKINQSPLLTDPLRMLHATAPADGACAIVLSKQPLKNQLAITLSALRLVDHHSLTQRASFTSFTATQQAFLYLRKTKNLDVHSIDFFELDDSYAIGEVLALEDLGLVAQGQTLQHINKNKLSKPINLSGGLKAFGNPLAASGLRQLYSIIKNLSGDKKQRGLTHIIGGVGHKAALCVLEKA